MLENRRGFRGAFRTSIVKYSSLQRWF